MMRPSADLRRETANESAAGEECDGDASGADWASVGDSKFAADADVEGSANWNTVRQNGHEGSVPGGKTPTSINFAQPGQMTCVMAALECPGEVVSCS
jgi:hypothetical protein